MKRFPPWTWDIPEHFNIGIACTDAHLGTPREQHTALIVDDEASGSRSLSFAALASRTDQFANVLEDLGVAAGTRVLIRLNNCLEYPVVFLGTLKHGAIAVPTSVLLTAEETLHLLQDSGACVLVTDRRGWEGLRTPARALPALRHVLLVGEGTTSAGKGPAVRDLATALAAAGPRQAAHVTRADDPAYLVYTSGTTGYPKGVVHAHRALLGRQPSSRYWFDFLESGERVLHCGKFNWTFVLGTGMMDPLYHGHTAILYEGSNDAGVWPRLIARHGATTFIAVPTLYRQILQKTAFGRDDVPTLRHCMSAGEALSEELLTTWKERFGLDIYEGLGMTECSYYICQTRSRPIRAGSAGFIQPGHGARLLDPHTWNEVASGEEGMICIPRDDPGLMLGYWKQPEETAACMHGEWFLTGDFARRDAEGYVWFLGRKDDLINSFGYRVSPHEVERILREHPDIADAAVAGEDAGPGKCLVAAFVVPRPGSRLSEEEIVRYGRTRLAAYKAPRVAYLLDELPRTRNGKVQRGALSPPRSRGKRV